MIQAFDVISTPKPINVAYSTVGLDFHMDLMYYESPPGLQFLHCLRYEENMHFFNKYFYMDTCQAPHLEINPKHLTMATIALFSACKLTHCTLVSCDSE